MDAEVEVHSWATEAPRSEVVVHAPGKKCRPTTRLGDRAGPKMRRRRGEQVTRQDSP